VLTGLAAIARALNEESTVALLTLFLGIAFAIGSLLAANPRFRDQLRLWLKRQLDRLSPQRPDEATGSQRHSNSDF